MIGLFVAMGAFGVILMLSVLIDEWRSADRTESFFAEWDMGRARSTRDVAYNMDDAV